jgi:ADP-ribose pyrophosphatase YjhB (NUDIX family)
MKDGKYFNVRVYAILYNNVGEILIADEFHYNQSMRKFPGGGLQFGEGIRDCVIRELKEELNVEVNELELFYTSEEFIQSVFNKDHQVIGIYYLAKAPNELLNNYNGSYMQPTKNGDEIFKWIAINNLEINDFTFPADQAAFKMLKNEYIKKQSLFHY